MAVRDVSVRRLALRRRTAPDPPEVDDSDWATVWGMAAVSPSDEVVEALQAVHKAMVDFQIEVLTLRGAARHRADQRERGDRRSRARHARRAREALTRRG